MNYNTELARLCRILTYRICRLIRRCKNDITLIGLTGGIASGKSTVAQMLRQAGILVIDLDTLAKDVITRDQMLRNKVSSCVGLPLDPFDSVARQALQQRIFGNEQLRRQVEQIVHPAVLKEFWNRVKDASSQGFKVVVCESALLIDTGYSALLDLTIVVACPQDIRRSRLAKKTGLDQTAIARVLASQISEQVRISSADRIIDNSLDTDWLRRQVDSLLDEFRQERWLASP